MTNKISKLGYMLAGLAWLGMIYMMGASFACVQSHTCDGGDFVLSAILSVGYLGPAYLVGRVVTEFTKG